MLAYFVVSFVKCCCFTGDGVECTEAGVNSGRWNCYGRSRGDDSDNRAPQSSRPAQSHRRRSHKIALIKIFACSEFLGVKFFFEQPKLLLKQVSFLILKACK